MNWFNDLMKGSSHNPGYQFGINTQTGNQLDTATNIIWSDAVDEYSQANNASLNPLNMKDKFGNQVNKPIPGSTIRAAEGTGPAYSADEGMMPIETKIKFANTFANDLEGFTDKNTANAFKQAITDSSFEVLKPESVVSPEEALADQLEKQIKKAESSRAAIKLLSLGIALVGGKNASAASQAANRLAGNSDERIKSLYAQKEKALDQIRGYSKVEQQGSVGWEATDGKIYFQAVENGKTVWKTASGDMLPAGQSLTKKVGTGSYGDLPRWVGTSITGAASRIRTAKNKLARMTNIISTKPLNEWSGIFGRGAEGLKNLFGTQDAISEWRRKIEEFIGQESLTNLPPGPASDRDIQIVRNAQVNGFANREAVNNYLDAVKRLTDYAISYDQAYINYFEQGNRNPAGFVGPDYPGNKTGGASGTTGNNYSTSDLDTILGSK